jgi:hypothetical protein
MNGTTLKNLNPICRKPKITPDNRSKPLPKTQKMSSRVAGSHTHYTAIQAF